MTNWTELRGEADGEKFVIRTMRQLPDASVQRANPQRLILGLAYDDEGDDAAKAQVRLIGSLADIKNIKDLEATTPIWEITDEADASWSYVKQIAKGP